jgi:diketogulonate reductase-like aldo/keto reductase
MYHPYVLREQAPTIAFCAQHKIVVTGWSPLMYVTRRLNVAFSAFRASFSHCSHLTQATRISVRNGACRRELHRGAREGCA